MVVVVGSVDSQNSDGDDKASATPASTDEPHSLDHRLSPPPVPRSTTPSPGRKRRSRDQIEADERKAKRRSEAREERRAEKAEQQEERKREQQKRRELAEQVKCLRPENCLKSLTICIDPAVLQHGGADILLDSLSSSGWRFVIDSQQLPQTILLDPGPKP
ncbi:hypothetical protein CRUP_029998, partial [Coryphaenoides rupestris]